MCKAESDLALALFLLEAVKGKLAVYMGTSRVECYIHSAKGAYRAQRAACRPSCDASAGEHEPGCQAQQAQS